MTFQKSDQQNPITIPFASNTQGAERHQSYSVTGSCAITSPRCHFRRTWTFVRIDLWFCAPGTRSPAGHFVQLHVTIRRQHHQPNFPCSYQSWSIMDLPLSNSSTVARTSKRTNIVQRPTCTVPSNWRLCDMGASRILPLASHATSTRPHATCTPAELC